MLPRRLLTLTSRMVDERERTCQMLPLAFWERREVRVVAVRESRCQDACGKEKERAVSQQVLLDRYEKLHVRFCRNGFCLTWSRGTSMQQYSSARYVSCDESVFLFSGRTPLPG